MQPLNSCRNIINDYKYNELENKKDYINKRQVEISRELTDTEEKLKTFREKNRDILSSPALMLEQARLMR